MLNRHFRHTGVNSVPESSRAKLPNKRLERALKSAAPNRSPLGGQENVDFRHCQKVLERAGVVFADGLSEAELSSVENRYGFQFPADLREYLAHALPTGNGFPNWRHLEDDPQIATAMAWPLEGICFDIEHNAFWPNEWGERPSDPAAAFEVARRHVEAAPKLIPIRGHRYLPAEPAEPGNPVFSVYQTDIIYRESAELFAQRISLLLRDIRVFCDARDSHDSVLVMAGRTQQMTIALIG